MYMSILAFIVWKIFQMQWFAWALSAPTSPGFTHYALLHMYISMHAFIVVLYRRICTSTILFDSQLINLCDIISDKYSSPSDGHSPAGWLPSVSNCSSKTYRGEFFWTSQWVERSVHGRCKYVMFLTHTHPLTLCGPHAGEDRPSPASTRSGTRWDENTPKGELAYIIIVHILFWGQRIVARSVACMAETPC